MSDQISRRTIARGTAWAAPALLTAAAAPANASSPLACGTPTLDIQYVWFFNWGDPGTDTQTTGVRLEFSDLQFTISNLAPGVSVTKIEWGMWLDLRYTGNTRTWRNSGIPYPDSKVDSRSSDPTTSAQLPCWGNGACGWTNLTWGGVTTSNGLITGGTPRVFRDGSTRQAWQLRETWTNTGQNFTATNSKTASNPTGCGTFQTGKMGISNKTGGEVAGKTGMDSHWFLMTATETRWDQSASVAVRNYQTIHGAIAYLSDGTTVTTDNSPASNPSSWL